MSTHVKLNQAEIVSKHTRVDWAENLILQLPKTHEGRKSWLLNYGVKEEAQTLRSDRNIPWNEQTRSAEIIKTHRFFNLHQINSSNINFWHKSWEQLSLSECAQFARLIELDNTENGHLKSLYEAYRIGRSNSTI